MVYIFPKLIVITQSFVQEGNEDSSAGMIYKLMGNDKLFQREIQKDFRLFASKVAGKWRVER